jgi:hypothetical protein
MSNFFDTINVSELMPLASKLVAIAFVIFIISCYQVIKTIKLTFSRLNVYGIVILAVCTVFGLNWACVVLGAIAVIEFCYGGKVSKLTVVLGVVCYGVVMFCIYNVANDITPNMPDMPSFNWPAFNASSLANYNVSGLVAYQNMASAVSTFAHGASVVIDYVIDLRVIIFVLVFAWTRSFQSAFAVVLMVWLGVYVYSIWDAEYISNTFASISDGRSTSDNVYSMLSTMWTALTTFVQTILMYASNFFYNVAGYVFYGCGYILQLVIDATSGNKVVPKTNDQSGLVSQYIASAVNTIKTAYELVPDFGLQSSHGNGKPFIQSVIDYTAKLGKFFGFTQ